MKRFLYKLVFFLPLLLILIVVNAWIDPIHMISNSYYEKSGEILAKDGMIYEDCDGRELMIEFLKHKKNCDTLIFGSSRTAIIDTGYFGKSILNLSLSSALLEDLISIYGLYISNHQQPKRMLLGIDPWSFNGHRKANSDYRLLHYYNLMMNKMSLKEIPVANTSVFNENNNQMNLISFKYFQYSLISIWKNGFRRKDPEICNTNDNFTIKKANGSLSYFKSWQSNPNDVDISVLRDISNDDLAGTEGFTDVSMERVQLFSNYLKYLISQKIEVTLYLSPYHPRMWNYISTNHKYDVFERSEKIVRTIACKYKISIIGSYNPQKYNMNSSDFYDAVHAKPSGLKKVFNVDYNK